MLPRREMADTPPARSGLNVQPARPSLDDDGERGFLRRGGVRQVPRNRRRQLWRRGLGLAGNFVLALVLVGAVPAALYWATHSPRFAWRHIEIRNCAKSDAAALERALAPLTGANIFALDLGLVRAALKEAPWVADVEVRKVIPDTVAVHVHEKRAAALWRNGDTLVYVDASGSPIVPLAPLAAKSDGGDFIILDAVDAKHASPERLAAAIGFYRDLEERHPELARQLSVIELLGEGYLGLEQGPEGCPRLLVDPRDFDSKYEAYQALAPSLAATPLAVVDLRWRDRLVIRRTGEAVRRAGEAEI